LVTGSRGQVGTELLKRLPALGDVIATTRADLDLANVESVRRAVRAARPRIIINAAAYNAVDRAEQEQELALAVNATAPGVLAEEAARLDALLVHYSTDYVFDGMKRRPYTEEDQPAPLNAYGRSKLAGESAVRLSKCRQLVLRTSWVFGPHGANFVLAMAERIRAGQALRVVSDQIGVPTPSSFIAEATVRMIAARSAVGNLYHVVADGETSRYEFVRAIAAELGVAANLTPVKSDQFDAAAARPSYSVLDNSKAAREFGLRPPTWQEALRACIQTLGAR